MKGRKDMPKRKFILFFVILMGFLSILSTAIVMTYPRYQKTMEQLPELITSDTTASNRALLNIKEQLDAKKEMADGQKIVWTGSVCASKYMTLSGSERIYYVCPYIVANTVPLQEDTSSNWTFSLQFAVSAIKDGKIYTPDTNLQVKEILFSCRVGENASILGAGYGDGEMAAVNGKSVSYQFRDRAYIDTATNVFARLSLGQQTTAETILPKEEKAVVNWSFQILEKNHVIGEFNDVQIDIPYQLELPEKRGEKND